MPNGYTPITHNAEPTISRSMPPKAPTPIMQEAIGLASHYSDNYLMGADETLQWIEGITFNNASSYAEFAKVCDACPFYNIHLATARYGKYDYELWAQPRVYTLLIAKVRLGAKAGG